MVCFALMFTPTHLHDMIMIMIMFLFLMLQIYLFGHAGRSRSSGRLGAGAAAAIGDHVGQEALEPHRLQQLQGRLWHLSLLARTGSARQALADRVEFLTER